MRAMRSSIAVLDEHIDDLFVVGLRADFRWQRTRGAENFRCRPEPQNVVGSMQLSKNP